MMDAEMKAKWVAALRSGEYKQVRMVLRSEDGFCCLGVLNEACGLPQTYHPTTTCFGDRRPNAPWGFDDNVSLKLQWMNDREGKTFSEIADWVEANL